MKKTIYLTNDGRYIFKMSEARLVAMSETPPDYDDIYASRRELYLTRKGNWVMVYRRNGRPVPKVISTQTAQQFILKHADDETIKRYCQDIAEV